MTNEDLEALIDALNKGEMKDLVFRAKISSNVEYAKVWRCEPKGGICNEQSSRFYFLSGDDGKIIGAVFDMYSDLHVFVKAENRGQGYLTRALESIILPHIRDTSPNREQQDLTFEDPELARRYAKHWAFKMTSETSATKALSDIAGPSPAAFQGRAVTHEEFKSMRKRIDKARLQLRMVQEQLEMSCGSAPEILDSYIDEIGNLDDNILSYIEKQQGNLVK
jgi:hypothetical protein